MNLFELHLLVKIFILEMRRAHANMQDVLRKIFFKQKKNIDINIFWSVEKNLADANMEFISKNVRQQGKECFFFLNM